MTENGKYQYDLVERLSFVRCGGTDEEARAAGMIQEEIASAGGESSVMEFEIPAYDVHKCSVSIPGGRELQCVAYGLSGDIDRELKLLYADNGTAQDYTGIDDLSDTVVMINALSFDAYKLLCDKKAAAFITISGKYYDDDETSDLVSRALRPQFLELGRIPGFTIRARDAVELVRNEIEALHLELSQSERTAVSRNVLAVIPGERVQGESIVITAHYDSVTVGTGSWDNATGSATIMYLYRYFLENRPRRTLRFIWCGSEEQGLLGSKAYIEQNGGLLKEIKLCFNFDMCGTALGSHSIKVTGGEDVREMARQLCLEAGFPAEVTAGVHSSDSAPFADNGIPGIGITRRTAACEIHTRNDLMFPLSPAQLAKTAEFAALFISRAANAVTIPVETKMPDDMKEDLEKYFMRDKQKAAAAEKEQSPDKK